MSKESKKVNDFNNEITVENMINELVKKANIAKEEMLKLDKKQQIK